MRQELKGRVEHIAETRKFDSGFQVRDFVVEIDGHYPQYIKLQFDRDSCSKLDSIEVGMEVHVEYFLNGRKWNGPDGIRYFTTLRAANIQVLDSQGLNSGSQQTQTQTSSISPQAPPKVEASQLTPPLTSSEVPKARQPQKTGTNLANSRFKEDPEEDGDMPF